jgi:site-specific recombinase XerD
MIERLPILGVVKATPKRRAKESLPLQQSAGAKKQQSAGAKKQQQRKSFAHTQKSFLGFLEANDKASSTLVSYRGDLKTFEEFLNRGLGTRPVTLQKITIQDLDRYQDYLQGEGFKTNTRRRKVLVLRKLLKWLHQRKQLRSEIGARLPTLKRSERIPLTIETPKVIDLVRALPAETELEARNRALLWLLAETGCQVSEVKTLRFEQIHQKKSLGKTECSIAFSGKNPRLVPISAAWRDAVLDLKGRQKRKDNPWIFLGFNKFGSLGGPISARGVELLVKSYADQLGEKKIVPRTLRHSVVLHWAGQGMTQKEIQERLGLRSNYAFRVYELMLKARGISLNSEVRSDPAP